MLKTITLTAALVMAASGIANAGGQEGTIGVGAEFQLSGLTGGPSINYDAGMFHVGGFFSFADDDGPDNTQYSIGGRFYYHVHQTAMADFGVGGALGILSFEPGMGADRATAVFIEPGAQTRLFLAANVAVSASVGLVIGVADADGVAITGQTITAGLHYYFF
jgi:hypothetical protein